MNFYDVLAAKNRDGGIPTINFFDLLFAQSMGGAEQWETYEGTLPATFNANGDDMRQYQIWGNVNGVGDRTVQLFDKTATDTNNGYIARAYLNSDGTVVSDNTINVSEYIPVSGNTDYILRYGMVTGYYNVPSVCFYDISKDFISGLSYSNKNPKSFTTPASAAYVRISFRRAEANVVALAKGSTIPEPLPPFGYEVDMATGSNILQSSEIEQDGWYAVAGTVPQKMVNPKRCRSKNIYPISSKKIFYDFKSLNVNIAFIDSGGLSLGDSGFKSGVGSVDVSENAVKCLFIIANTDTDTNIIPAQVIAAGIWASVDTTTTPIYIGDEPLDKDEYADYQSQKVYRMINGTLTPTDPPVPLPALPTCEGETVVDYAGSGAAPEKVVFEYKKGGN